RADPRAWATRGRRAPRGRAVVLPEQVVGREPPTGAGRLSPSRRCLRVVLGIPRLEQAGEIRPRRLTAGAKSLLPARAGHRPLPGAGAGLAGGVPARTRPARTFGLRARSGAC